MSEDYLRIGQAAALLGVSVDTLRRWHAEGRLALQRSAGGQRVVTVEQVHNLLEQRRGPQRPVRAQSARNQLTAVVTEVVRDSAAATVAMQAGPFRLLALVTAESVDELGLGPGVDVIASVKATSVVVSLPAGS